MRGDYGTDDMGHLIDTSDQPGTVAVAAHGKSYNLPIARFDNRTDLTSFLREDTWDDADVAKIHEGLASALQSLPRS